MTLSTPSDESQYMIKQGSVLLYFQSESSGSFDKSSDCSVSDSADDICCKVGLL